jgi:probable rRNA maturation factor
MVNITINNLQKRLPIPKIRVKKLILKIIKGEGLKITGFINLCFTDNILIKKLNLKFLKNNNPTDARSFKTCPEDELLLYVAHGLLHILGFNDHTKTETQLMRKKEREYADR